MSQLFLRKTFVDPFESEYVKHYEIVELIRIYYYSKRTASAPYEIQYVLHEFNLLGESVLEKCNLTIWEYFTILKGKSKEIQEKFKYKKTEMLTISEWKYEDIATKLGIEIAYKENKESYDNIFNQHILSPY